MVWDISYLNLPFIMIDGRRFGLTGKVVGYDKLKHRHMKDQVKGMYISQKIDGKQVGVLDIVYTKVYEIGLDFVLSIEIYIKYIVMQTSINNLSFSLYAALFVYQKTATSEIEQSPRRVSFDNSVLSKNTKDKV